MHIRQIICPIATAGKGPALDVDTIWRHIDAERTWLADLLESLPDEGWAHPSLCTGWTVRDVGAHLTFAQTPVAELLWPAVRAGFRYDVMIRDTALRSPLGHGEIVAALRGFVGSRRRISFITDLEPLLDTLIHIQDICRPLGVKHPMPPEAAAASADRVLATPWPLRRWGRQPSIRRIATDTDWAYGAGPEVYATVEQHLLMLTGRQPTPDI